MQREEPHDIIDATSIPPYEDHKYLRLTPVEHLVLKDKSPKERGEWMRKHMPTSEILARWLVHHHLPVLAERAHGGEFDDFRSPHATPKMLLYSLLHKAGRVDLARIVADGAFDAQPWEAEAWGKSPEGQAAIGKLEGAIKDDPARALDALNAAIGDADCECDADELREVMSEDHPNYPRKLRGDGPEGPLKAGDVIPLEGTELDLRVDDVREERDEDGNVYPALDATVTRRLSADNPNPTNAPKGKIDYGLNPHT